MVNGGSLNRMTSQFDSLEYAQRLERAGVPEEQAAVHAHVLQQALSHVVCQKQLTTSEDGLRRDLRQTETRLTTEIQRVRDELHAKIELVRVDLEAKIERVRVELDAKIETVRIRLEAKIDAVHTNSNTCAG